LRWKHPTLTRFLAVVVIAVALSGELVAQTARVGPEFQVNTYTTSSQESPRVVRGSSGEFVVVWQSFGPDGSDFGIFGQRFDASRTPVGGEFQLNSYTTNGQSAPAAAIDTAGNVDVVWGSSLQDGSFSGVYGRRFNASNVPLAPAFRANTYTSNNQLEAAVDVDSSGNFVVVWDSYCGSTNTCGQDGAFGGVFGQRYTSAGATAGSEFRVNSTTSEDQSNPSVGKADAGNFVVVWQSYYQEQTHPQDPPPEYGIFGQRYDSLGVKSGSEFAVNTYTSRTQESPAVSMNGSGAFVVTWESYGQLGVAGYDVIGQRFNSSGTKVGGEFVVNTYTSDDQISPSVAMDDTGRWVIVWQSRPQGFPPLPQDGSASGIYGQRYNSDGTKHGVEFRVNTYTTLDQRTPSVAMDGSGNFVVAWTSYGQDGSGTGVFAQAFSSVDCSGPSATGPSPNQAACQRGTAFFTVTASGLSPFTYQWRKNGVNLVDSSHIAGSNSQTLKVEEAAAADAGSYSCVVSDGCLPAANVASSSATFTLTPGQAIGVVTNLRLGKLNGGANLQMTWTGAANATDYVVFQDADVSGVFSGQASPTTSGAITVTIPTPSGSRYYLIAGKNAACGVGTQSPF
jgi:hypothetical protein